MLVGEPPYSGATAQAVLAKILTDPAPAPTRVRLSIPPNLDAAIRKALEKLPADRFASAEELSKALADPGFRHGEEAAVEVAVGGGQWTPLAMATTVAAIVSTLALGWLLLRPDPPQPVSRQYLSTEGWAGFEAQIGRQVAIAPDGSSMILPVASGETGSQLALKTRSSTEITPIPGTEGAWDVVYSPDGQWIAYGVGSDLFKRPIVGGSPLRLAEDTQSLGIAVAALDWLDDGTILYEQFSGSNADERPRRITRISEDGGDPEVIFRPEEFPVAPVWVHGLPGARGAIVVACVGITCTPDATQVYIVDLDDLSSELVFEQALRVWYAPTGHLVYVRSDGSVLAQPFDLAELELTGSAIPLFAGVRTTASNSSFPDLVLGADGTLLYVEGAAEEGFAGGAQLVVVDLEGNEETLPLAPRDIDWVSWSPDGQSVVYESDNQIYMYNVALGTTPRQLTFEGNSGFPVFSPDGTRVAFSSVREGTLGPDVFVKNLDDDSPPRSLATIEGPQVATQWPSEALILLGGNGDLGMVDLSDPDSGRVSVYLSSEALLFNLLVSPDGSLATYRSNETGEFEIYIRSFPDPGERTVISQGGGEVPFWSADGNTLYYTRVGAEGRTFMAARLQQDPVPVVLSTDSLFTGSYNQPSSSTALHPDGDRWIVSTESSTVEAETGVAEPQQLLMVTNFFEELRQVVPDN